MLILPAVDIRGGKCVRLFQGDYSKETVYADNPSGQALRWEAEGAKILHLVDLDGAKEGHPANLPAIREICSSVKIPCELGGGIRTEADAQAAFDAGVSRVIIGTAACENPSLIERLIEAFGPEKVVLGVDAKDGKVAIKGWLEVGQDAQSLIREIHQRYKVARVIFTDISKDGALKGPNLQSTAAVCRCVPGCKVIASGGVSSPADIASLKALGCENLEGAIVGKALYEGRTGLKELSKAAQG